jgi:hypothetical protein
MKLPISSVKQTQVDLRPIFVAAGLPEPVREFRFAPPRRWRWDYCWPEEMVAVEIQGGVWRSMHHTRGRGYIDDCRKMAEGVLRGWRVLWIPTDWLRDRTALDIISKVLHG